MARIRSIKPQAFTSESLAEVSVYARWTFAGLWTYVDDAGRGKADPRLIKGQIWPLDDDVTSQDVATFIDELEAEGMVCRYEVGDRTYLHVVRWHEHQSINKATPSKLPSCPTHSPNDPVVRDPYEGVPMGLREEDGSPTGDGPEGYRGEQGRGSKEQGRGRETPSPDPAALVLVTADAATERAPGFDDFWGHYPRKVGKDDARKAWDKATKGRRIPAAVIIAGAKRYAEDPNLPEKQFIPHPATWLTRGGWDDEPCAPRAPQPSSQQSAPPPRGSGAWNRQVRLPGPDASGAA